MVFAERRDPGLSVTQEVGDCRGRYTTSHAFGGVPQ